MRARPLALAAAAAWLTCAPARGDETLRIGSIVPAGTGWAREAQAMGRDVEQLSSGSLHLKYYLGGIAGDELEMMARMQRGQLDGVLSGGMACEAAAPSLRVTRIPGLLQTWEETSFVLSRLRPLFEEEAKRAGDRYLGEAIVGPSILFSRTPVASLADFKKTRAWVWDVDKMLIAVLRDMGVAVQPMPIALATRAYEQRQLDAFIAPAVAALGFQWSAATHYFTDMRLGFVVGCLIVSNRTFDALPLADQEVLRQAAAKLKAHYEDVGRAQEEQLMHGLFRKQGLQQVTFDETARASFFEAAAGARSRAAAQVVSPALIARVLGMVADFRSEHR
jgi:TRAP-type transport system periplasmic protein